MSTAEKPTMPTCPLPADIFIVKMMELRQAAAAIDVAATCIREFVPPRDAKGDIVEAGRRVEWLCAQIADEAARVHAAYLEMMQSAGFKPDNSGLYGA